MSTNIIPFRSHDHELRYRFKLYFAPVQEGEKPREIPVVAVCWEEAITRGCRMAGEGYRLVSARRSK